MSGVYDSAFPRFCIAGGVGFLVDASILHGLVSGAGWGPISARLVSLLSAVTVTWVINRSFSFKYHRRGSVSSEWMRYVGVNAVGAVVNLALYVVLIKTVPGLGHRPVSALAIAAAVALIFNYTGSKRYVFRDRGVV